MVLGFKLRYQIVSYLVSYFEDLIKHIKYKLRTVRGILILIAVIVSFVIKTSNRKKPIVTFRAIVARSQMTAR
jgi:hypothetical protein